MTMLSAWWVVVAVVVAVLLTWRVTFTITRLDRLHARVDAAQAAMDAQFVRRAAALAALAESVPRTEPHTRELHDQLAVAAHDALSAPDSARVPAENGVTRAIAALPEAMTALRVPESALTELNEASLRAAIARSFYNDAVRDTRALRDRRIPRLLRLSGHRELPQFFDIEDATAVQVISRAPLSVPPVAAPSPTQSDGVAHV